MTSLRSELPSALDCFSNSLFNACEKGATSSRLELLYAPLGAIGHIVLASLLLSGTIHTSVWALSTLGIFSLKGVVVATGVKSIKKIADSSLTFIVALLFTTLTVNGIIGMTVAAISMITLYSIKVLCTPACCLSSTLFVEDDE